MSCCCFGAAPVNQKKGDVYGSGDLEGHLIGNIKQLSYKELVTATDDFHPRNKIGQGGFGTVYKFCSTSGYLAPEYVLGGKLTKKADVYSFGVLVLEIVSGRSSGKANWGGMQKLLLEWTWQLYEEGQEGFPKDEVIRYIKVALFCTQATACRRPTMSQVVDMLSRNIHLNEKEILAPG